MTLSQVWLCMIFCVESNDILLEPLLPVIFGKTARDAALNNALPKKSAFIKDCASAMLTLKRTVGVT